MDNPSSSMNLPEIYTKFKKSMLKHYIINLTPYTNLINFLSEESIHLDQDTMDIIEKEFKEKISEIFEDFGSVFVKLNYSAATDSDFLVHKLECFKLEDILVIMKGSNKLNTNFEIFLQNHKNENKTNLNLFLILKKYYDIRIENEFRLFIHNKEIKGISQRHLNICFKYDQNFLNEVLHSILSFYENEIKPNADLFSDKLFMDVLYLEKSNKIKIIDIIGEETREELNKYSENEDDSEYFLLCDNWDTISKSSKIDFSYNIKVIGSNEEIIEKKENLNKFPLDIIGEENAQNINDIINLLSQNKEEFDEFTNKSY